MTILAIKVPNMGDFTDIPVIEILVKPGDVIAKEQALVVLESDKATMDVPSSHAGIVKEVKVKVGDTISEGDVVIILNESGASAPTSAVTTPVSSTTATPQHTAPAAAAPGCRTLRRGSSGRRLSRCSSA